MRTVGGRALLAWQRCCAKRQGVAKLAVRRGDPHPPDASTPQHIVPPARMCEGLDRASLLRRTFVIDVMQVLEQATEHAGALR